MANTTTTTSTPPSRAEIDSLLASENACAVVSPSNVPVLEAYLTAQCTGQTPYHFEAVRMLVKLYQLFLKNLRNPLKNRLRKFP